ncbi:hypothetical protein HAX54_028641, partial [Datura stramonium]|nr:hypothetical protein [Datura stramonium]
MRPADFHSGSRGRSKPQYLGEPFRYSTPAISEWHNTTDRVSGRVVCTNRAMWKRGTIGLRA